MQNLYENSDFNCKRIDIADQFCLYIHRPQFNHNTHMYICSVTQNLYKNSAYRSSRETIFTIAFKLLALFLILWTVFNILVSFHGIFACRAIASFLGAISGSFLGFFSLFLVFELVLATGSSGTRKKSKLNTAQFRSSSKGDRKGCEDENLYSFFHKIHSFLQFL